MGDSTGNGKGNSQHWFGIDRGCGDNGDYKGNGWSFSTADNRPPRINPRTGDGIAYHFLGTQIGHGVTD